ncbi:MAG: hypothetical protein AAB358_03800 [Patescibacteria group bacterium]
MKKEKSKPDIFETSWEDIKAMPTESDYLKGRGRPLLMTKAARLYLIKHLGHDVQVSSPEKRITLRDAREFVKWYREIYLPSIEMEKPTDDLSDLPADLPEDLRALAAIDPFVKRGLASPFIPKNVHDFLKRELRKLRLGINAVHFSGPVDMGAAVQAINDLRARRGWRPVKA